MGVEHLSFFILEVLFSSLLGLVGLLVVCFVPLFFSWEGRVGWWWVVVEGGSGWLRSGWEGAAEKNGWRWVVEMAVMELGLGCKVLLE